MDLIIKFESLEEGFTALRTQLNVEDLDFPHKLESEPNKLIDVEPNTSAFIKDFYGCDYDAFGY
jgi:hypothetical protein